MFTPDLLHHFPLTFHEDGTLRVTGTRVLLDMIVRQFKLGSSPEHICESYPSLTLRDAYGALFFYLNYTPEVEAYLHRQQEEAAEIRSRIEASPYSGNSSEIRERLLARASQAQRESFSR
jgi:uncharacterized protein (DUF433 family)